MEDGIKSCTKQKGKKAALKLQINFRRKVLGQTHPDKAVFQFSHNQKQYTIAQLKNLLLLIGVIEEPEPSNDGGIQLSDIMLNPELLVAKNIKHRFQVGLELVWYTGTVISMNPNTMEHQVQYEGEDDICSFTLLDDILSGDLELS